MPVTFKSEAATRASSMGISVGDGCIIEMYGLGQARMNAATHCFILKGISRRTFAVLMDIDSAMGCVWLLPCNTLAWDVKGYATPARIVSRYHTND